MHHATTYALGLATGAVVAAIALHAARGGPGGEPVGGAVEGSPAVAATGGALLAGRSPGVAPVPAGEGHAERFEQWYEQATERFPDPRRPRSILWLGLVRAYAAAGRHKDLQRVCDRALGAGVPPAELLETLRTAGASPSLQGLITRHPQASWDLRSRLEATDARDPAPVLEALRDLRERLRAQNEGQPAAAEPPGLPGLAELLARLAVVDPARALAEADALCTACGDDAQIAALCAEGLRADPTGALRFVRRGLESVPLHNRLLSLYMAYDLPAATAHLEAILARDPAAVAAWEALASARSRAEDGPGVILALVQAATHDPSHERLDSLASLDPGMALPLIVAATEGAGARDVDLWDLRARVELRSGTPEAAVDAWIRMAALDPSSSQDEEMVAWVALAPRRVADALAPTAERALATLDDDHLRIYTRALVAAEDPRAFEVCRRALDKGLWSDGVPTQLARADPVAALPLLEARRARDPRNFEVLAAMGEAYLATRRPNEAAAALEGAIAASGGDWMPWNHDAWVGLARADPVAGLAKVRACADQMSGAAGSGLLGDALAATGRTAEARAAYDRAIEIEPDSTVWRTRRAALR